MATAATIGRDYRDMAPAECACGRCDKKPSGPGAAAVMAPTEGYIVACADCLKEILAEAREIERQHSTRRRFLH